MSCKGYNNIFNVLWFQCRGCCICDFVLHKFLISSSIYNFGLYRKTWLFMYPVKRFISLIKRDYNWNWNWAVTVIFIWSLWTFLTITPSWISKNEMKYYTSVASELKGKWKLSQNISNPRIKSKTLHWCVLRIFLLFFFFFFFLNTCLNLLLLSHPPLLPPL